MVKQYNEDSRQNNKSKLNNSNMIPPSFKSRGSRESSNNVKPEFKIEVVDRAKDKPLDMIATPEGPFVIGRP